MTESAGAQSHGRDGGELASATGSARHRHQQDARARGLEGRFDGVCREMGGGWPSCKVVESSSRARRMDGRSGQSGVPSRLTN